MNPNSLLGAYAKKDWIKKTKREKILWLQQQLWSVPPCRDPCWTTPATAQQKGKQFKGIQGIKGKALQAWKWAENWGGRTGDISRTERKSKVYPTNTSENNSSDGAASWKLGLGNNPRVVESSGEVITGRWSGNRKLWLQRLGIWSWSKQTTELLTLGLSSAAERGEALGMWPHPRLGCLGLTGFDARVVDLGVKVTDHYLSRKYSFFCVSLICLAFKYVLLLHILLSLSRFLFKLTW